MSKMVNCSVTCGMKSVYLFRLEFFKPPNKKNDLHLVHRIDEKSFYPVLGLHFIQMVKGDSNVFYQSYCVSRFLDIVLIEWFSALCLPLRYIFLVHI